MRIKNATLIPSRTEFFLTKSC